MNVLEKAQKILHQPVCDSCLGRQFAQLLSGFTNRERGAMLRAAVAMSLDRTEEESSEVSKEGRSSLANALDMSNFESYSFHNLEQKKAKKKECSVCGGLFSKLNEYADRAAKEAKKYDFRTFLVGTKLPSHMIEKEEALWERVGIDYCEPIKAEINREIGKLLEKKASAKFDGKRPDINVIMNLGTGKTEIGINPVFVYGEYQKLKRGIPQTKWPSGKYKTSVEQIIAKPFMPVARAKGHKLHGLGREDIDARCLGWRPFVLELLEPKVRSMDPKKLARKVRGAVRVRKIRYSDIAEVRKIKETKADKTYTVTVKCRNKIDGKRLKQLSFIKQVSQQTPERVLHRRADKFRKRTVRSLKTRKLGPKSFRLTMTCEAGLYVKELVHGDSGRTKPSIAEILGTECTPSNLDVLKIHVKK